MVKEVRALVLAAGLGKRMKSALPKAAHTLAGEPMICHVLAALKDAGIREIAVVVGHGREIVEKAAAPFRATFVHQKEQLGTGHAVLTAREILPRTGTALVLPGDVPLVDRGVIESLIESHRAAKADATALTMIPDSPVGYGRIIREGDKFVAIREEKDCRPAELEIREVNTGVYAFESGALIERLDGLSRKNAQAEYYLTDVLGMLVKDRRTVKVLCLSREKSYKGGGINTRVQLAEAERRMMASIAERHMLAGVTIRMPESAYIAASAEIGADTEILPFCVIERNVKIGAKCRIGPCARIHEGASVAGGSVVGNCAEVKGAFRTCSSRPHEPRRGGFRPAAGTRPCG